MFEERKKYLLENNFVYREDTMDTLAIAENIKGNQYYLYPTYTKDDVWLDLGAHIGTFSCVIDPFVKKVYAYEASPENAQVLFTNVSKFCTHTVATLSAISAEEVDVVDLYLTNRNMYNVAHSIRPIRGRNNVVKVPAISINKVLHISHANKIKMDIEGVEEDALRTITDEHWSHIDEIIFEWHFSSLRDASHEKFYAMKAYLASKGLTYFHGKQLKKNRYAVAHASRIETVLPPTE